MVQASRRAGRLSFDRAQPSQPATGVVAACITQRDSFLKWVTTPLASTRKAGRVFRDLLDVELPFSVEDCEVALAETRPTPDRLGTRGLMAGARNGAIEKRLAELQTLGVTPHVLDQESLALWSQAADEFPCKPNARNVRVVAYLGAERTTLVVGQGDELLGAHSLRQVIPDQLLRLVKSHVLAHPDSMEWIWTGPVADSPGAVQQLHSSVLERWPGATMKMASDPTTFLARALAARALSSGAYRCNLRNGPFLHPLIENEQRRTPYYLACSVLLAALVLIAVNLGAQQATRRKLMHLQDEVHRAAVEITGSPRLVPRGQEVLVARRALEAQTLSLDPFLMAAAPPLTDTMKLILTIGQEEGLSIETLVLNRKTAVLHGSAMKWGQCEKAIGRLKNLGGDVKSERKDSPAGTERIAFIISIGLNRET